MGAKKRIYGTISAKSKKGSKKIREIISKATPEEKISNNILRFGEITDTFPNWELSKTMNKYWSENFLENCVRVFAFKLYNNNLGLNSRVQHFVQGKSGNCTFCDLAGSRVPERETITHLFQDCRIVEPVILEIIRWFWNGDTTRRDYLCGRFTDDQNSDKCWNILTLIVKWYIWDCKFKFKLPNTRELKKCTQK
jgi:hypothetical protein